jgi:hypothetical protein
MKILNPAFVPAVPDRPTHEKHKAAVVAKVKGLAVTDRAIDFAAIRASLPGIAADLTDGVLHQIALDAGFKVEQ